MDTRDKQLTTLWAVFDQLRGHTSVAEILPVVLSLYGLRVFAASERYYQTLGIRSAISQRWRQLKREGGNLGETLNQALEELGQDLSVPALKHPLSFTYQGADQLARAILALDKLSVSATDRADFATVGEVVDALLARFTDSGAKSGTEYTTPKLLNTLTAALLVPPEQRDPHTVYDPACGVAGGLVAVYTRLSEQAQSKVHIYGQDLDGSTLFLAAWNLLLHGVTQFTLAEGDTLVNPRFIEDDAIKRFDIALTNPPFYLVARDDLSKQDRYQRFRYGDVSGRSADFAFVQHILASLNLMGRAAIFMPVTALSRSFEEKIRSNLVHADVLEACISLPTGTFPATSTPAALLLFDLDKPDKERDRVFFMNLADAVGKSKGRDYPLDTSDIERFTNAFRLRTDTPGLSAHATLEEVKSNRYSLVPQRYVPAQQRERLDLDLLDVKITQGETELAQARASFDRILRQMSNEHG